MGMTALLKVDGLSKTHGVGDDAVRVLEDVSLELHRGEATSLTGVSGSGKSTLISLLAGLMPADSGRIVLDGSDLTQLDDRDRARLRAERIGVVLQRGNLIPFLTARENVEMAMALAGRGTARDQARALLAEVGLEQRLDHLPQRMSGGESQRVAVAVALANEPDLLLADEVTGELDSASELAVMDSLFHACERRALSVLYVTHDPEIAARAQRRLRLERKRVVPA